MRYGFTMIELIFSIVIIGILAAVAVPKLVATRDDAIESKILVNVETCKNEIINAYTTKGTSVNISFQEIKACQNMNAKHDPIEERIEGKDNGYTVKLTYILKSTGEKTEIFAYAGSLVKY